MVLVLLLLLSGCSLDFSETGDLRLRLPPLPADFPPPPGFPVFRVEYRGAETELVQVFSPPGEVSLHLKLPLGRPIPIRARLVWGEREDFFHPAGGLYPWGLTGDGELFLTWEDGFAADLALDLGEAGFPLGEFNLPRFFREVRSRGAGNPWFLDRERLIPGLEKYSFRADMIKKLPLFPVQVPAPPGDWWSWNRLIPRAVTGEDGFLQTEALPPGYHRFYRSQGGRMDVYLGRDGSLICTESGSW